MKLDQMECAEHTWEFEGQTGRMLRCAECGEHLQLPGAGAMLPEVVGESADADDAPVLECDECGREFHILYEFNGCDRCGGTLREAQ